MSAPYDLHFNLPAGTYWVADPSYVFHADWHKKCDEMLAVVNAQVLKDAGHPYLVVANFGGDGVYDGDVETTEGQKSFIVPVDAGMVGLIPVVLAPRAPFRNAPTVAFARPVSVVVERTVRGTTTAFGASDGRTSMRIAFADRSEN